MSAGICRVAALGLLLIACQVMARPAFAQTYTQTPAVYNFLPTAGATQVSTWAAGLGCPDTNGDDSLSAALNIGFTFRFGGTGYTQLRLFSNGRLQFANTYCYFGTAAVGPPRTYPNPMPDANTNNTIRVYGADLDLTAGGTLSYATIGSAPNRVFVATWSNVPQWSAAGTSYNLQIQLQENGDFLFMYGNSSNVSGGTTLGPAQLGWQLTPTDFQAQSGLPAAGTGYRYSPPRPALSVSKTSAVLSDPFNGSSNPKRIPGAVVRYSVTTTNAGSGTVDASTLVITDPVPANADLYVSTTAGDPVEFLDGAPASGLAFSYAANVAYSNQPGGGPPYTYTPVADAAGFDPAVTGVRVSPSGVMSASSGAGQPAFTVRFRVRIR
jgi:uncharacterized repeat protein (TIGR01451 family)